MERETYRKPAVEVLEVEAEQGYADSVVDAGIEGFDREEWNENE